ncbi:bifunctional proline dehydrogenase/L-glutamate gamma-semialdehyde dehydrogenase PutA [Paremcibacter congregatus]|uniref:Bifunctional protein PutA n=1 Tax=Paremcibacter congregatus TaxID=2043170 RepID=A0A2G4YSA9_9PROT|nr:bifunctional proline dehydrogenase/L-glutamate gamma-semialdehyde dehydrogenase PutA [Paremcibacter congregatus]PHZ84336.1 bifunctional proline dehydrogenase/L-glutamate gamma-semialdehyde dehydrogenase [Paremcibacter congregatus]QDE28556.1 bifunctional proline dehydrogenase/L-glutamate gamma-semialdehyde dehydrogenase PutA [Paremcibacter congregatus]
MYSLAIPAPDQAPGKTKSLSDIRTALRSMTHADEEKCIDNLLSSSGLTQSARQRIVTNSRDLVNRSRQVSDAQGTMDHFLQEFGLSNREGVALMCLAEALLRVPDGLTADKLIAEKIASGDWAEHKGKSESMFVNASTWGLMMTGGVVKLGRDVTDNFTGWMKRLVTKSGEPVIRKAVMQAMRIMGGQYVLGRTIEEAAKRGRKENRPDTRFSFDMLGEGARTLADAEQYFVAYSEAIEKIGAANDKDTVAAAHGISVKFSALHPRYEFAQHDTVMQVMYPKIHSLALAAKQRGLGFTIDAEEADRLDISLDIFEQLARSPELVNWDGLGIVVQAYQKRAPYVLDWLIALGTELKRKFMVRLVKGAYWDSEIKHAQEMGLPDYPVYTRKPSTDLSYQICAERMMAARDVLYPQFATHNAYTVALVLELAGNDRDFEFQRLHGMGHLLYEQLQKMTSPPVNMRVYAPVGAHKDLLPYLVRRLLENGANSSFVNRFMDKKVPVEELMQDCAELVQAASPRRHSLIPVPTDILSASGREPLPRKNAKGLDLADPVEVKHLKEKMEKAVRETLMAGPIVGGELLTRPTKDVVNPAHVGQVVGLVGQPTDADMDLALTKSAAAQKSWDALGGKARADILNAAADIMEAQEESLMGIIGREAGRTIADGLSEVREAVDFLRYYAMRAEVDFEEPILLPGCTGEQNELSLHGRGTFLCISPWNFPLAIFVGQLTAALAAGNAVIAKPAEQTPLIAAEAVKILHQAGVPGDVLHLIPGDGAHVGAHLVADPRISGIAFTGSTDTAKLINRTLAAKDGAIVPLIAETGGQNVMIVDSSALPEQVADDVIASAFQSAGQRCSALRVLYLQEEVADKIIDMLKGAVACLKMGDPMELSTDVGPVIDETARRLLVDHAARMDREATLIAEVPLPDACQDGTFFGPRIYEIETLDQLTREVFGPILHIIRYKARDLDKVLDQVRATGFGLTLGVHSRIEKSAQEIFQKLDVGNTYVNRNIVGAVVGVNPFGGQGLSGTGPKAGGPRYMYRFATEKTLTINTVATGGNTELFSLED